MSPSACPPRELLEAVAAGMTLDGEVANHVEGCAACTAELARLKAANRMAEDVARTSGSGEDPTPRVAGFEFLHEIHRGGQGVVWLARQESTRRTVAVKLLLTGRFATSRQRRRFEREIEVVAGLRHPAIVTVFESGTSDDGQIYCAMEYIEGSPLDRWCRAHQPSQQDRIKLLITIADALAEAHRRGVIHRDLKPANILVTEDGDPHVLDFGLVRLENERDAERGEMLQTVEGEFLGTFAYAAPEQLTGDPSAVDTRADVYALGLLLFEVLTGERPFTTPASIAELVDQRVDRTAPRPSSRDRAVGRELDLITLKALDPDVDRRYDTAGELAEELRRLLDGRPVRARGDGLGYLLWKAIQRHTIPVALSVLLLVLVVASTVSLFVLYQESEARREDAEAVEATIVEAFKFLDPQEGGSMQMRLPDLIARLEIVANEKLAAHPHRQVRVLRLAGQAFYNLERFEQAADCFQRTHVLQSDLGMASGETVSPGISTAEHDLGRVAYVTARRLERAAESAIDAGRTTEAVALIADAGRQLDIAEARYRAALVGRRRSGGVPPEDLAMTMQHLAATLMKAVALDRLVTNGPPGEDPRLAEGEALLTEALAVRRLIRPVELDKLATSWNTIASLREDRGDLEGSLDAARKAADLADGDSKDLGWWAGRAQAGLGRRLLEVGRAGQAIEPLQRGLEICSEVLGDTAGSVLRIRLDLAEAELLTGDAHRALELIRSIDVAEVAEPERVAARLLGIDTLVSLGRREEACEALADGLSLATEGVDRRFTRRLELLGGAMVDPDDSIDAVASGRWNAAAQGD